MSTRYYDTDLDDAAWAWIAPYLPRRAKSDFLSVKIQY